MVANDDVPSSLVDAICALLDDPERLAAMAGASSALARPDAADRLRGVLDEVARR
jgi:UDP-N-acetylglucosamine:LPS N-acetylglucosamine transferase